MLAVERKGETDLRFLHQQLFYIHADLRISLWEMRARQRNPRPLNRLEKFRMSALRFDEVIQEIFHIRFRQCQSRRRGIA
jgi:hypothetical protein